MIEIPIWRKVSMSLEEAAEYSHIGINKLRQLTEQEDCPFVLWVGSKRLIKREKFEAYINEIRPYKDKLPVYEGEINGQLSEGVCPLINTASAHVDIKQDNHRAQHLLERIAELERKQLWHLDVEDDPETYPLMPDKVDYLNEKLKNKIMNRIANRAGEKFFETLIKNGQLVIKEVRGIENFTAVEGGRLITCNHFSVGDNYAVWRAIRDHVDGKLLYKVIREGNYTNPPKPFGLIMKHCNTLPLSSRTDTMKKFMKAVKTLLGRGETILIYPEQGMWWNYRKPKPLKSGGFYFAAKNRVPVLPCYIILRDSDIIGEDGFPVQEYTIHILEPIYPDADKSVSENSKIMMEKNFEAWKQLYEREYGIPLRYTTEA